MSSSGEIIAASVSEAIKTVKQEEPPVSDVKSGFCLSCREHCDFKIVEITPAKNPKTEICKGLCPLIKTKVSLDADGKEVQSKVVCGARVCSIRKRDLSPEEEAQIAAQALKNAEARELKKEKAKRKKAALKAKAAKLLKKQKDEEEEKEELEAESLIKGKRKGKRVSKPEQTKSKRAKKSLEVLE